MRGTAGSKGSTMGFLTFIQLSSKEAVGLQAAITAWCAAAHNSRAPPLSSLMRLRFIYHS